MKPLAALLALLVLPPPSSARADGPSGVVRLTRVEYDRLKDDADGPAAPPRRKARDVPPSIEAARYDLKADATGASLELAADVVVKGPVRDARLVLPSAGRLESLGDRGPAAVLVSPTAPDERRTVLRFTSPGRYHVVARFLPTERDLPGGVRAYEFTTVAASSARLAASTAVPGVTFDWSAGGAGVETLPAGAVRPLPTSSLVSVRVKTAGGLPSAPAEKPIVIAEIVDAARPQRERLIVRTVAKLSVSRSDLLELALQFAPGSRLLSVSGPDEPNLVIGEDGRGLLRLGKPLRGEATFSALTWRAMPEAGDKVELQPTRVPSASALRSFLLVTPASFRRYEPVSNDGLQRTDSSDLPPLARPFVGGSTRAYRTIDAAKALLVFASPLRDITPVADTLVDEAFLLTVFGDGGVRTDQRRYAIQTKRPFFEVPIGAGEEIVSVSVDEVPVRSQGQTDRLVVVLPPSAMKHRTVQVVTKRTGVETPKKGELTVDAGPLAAAASLATWTVVLPQDRHYRFLESAGLRKAGWLAAAAAPETVTQAQPSNWLGTDANAIVSGRLADSSGAPLPGVTVQIRGSGFNRTLVSDAQGNFRIAGVPPGRYSIVASLSGFNSATQTVETKAGGGYFLPIPMRLAATETVTVTAESPAIDTSSSSIGMKVSRNLNAQAQAREDKSGKPKDGEGGVGAAAYDNAYVMSGVTQVNERSNAGVRSLPVEIIANGKRLVLSGPLAGTGPLWLRVAIK